MGLRANFRKPVKILGKRKSSARHSLDDLLLTGANEQIRRLLDQFHRKANSLKGDLLGWNVDEVSGRLAKVILARARAISNSLKAEKVSSVPANNPNNEQLVSKSRSRVVANQKRGSKRSLSRAKRK